MKIETALTHIGLSTDPVTGSITTPIYQVATFEHPNLGESTGFDYSRAGNPTRKALEEGIAKLEEGVAGFAFASGMAAITSLVHLFSSGDHFIVTEDLYGGTYRLFEDIFSNFKISVTYVDTSNIEKVKEAIQENTKAIFLETPTNPLLKIADILSICEIAKEKQILTIVDNTFLSPYLQKPLSLGADIVIHSASKYLGGHNDVVAGLVAVKEKNLAEKIYFIQKSAGSILGPQDSWLIIRGIKTLGLRMDRQMENAKKIALWLKSHSKVMKVYYPGLEEHEGYEVQKRQALGAGAVLSFEVEEEALAKEIINKVRLIKFAESLGGVESLITYPYLQTHADIPEDTRERLGISKRLLRMAVGIEHVEDLIEDLDKAFKGEEK